VALALLRATRPRQWVKNAACLAGLVFSGLLLSREAEVEALAATLLFCTASSSVYIINDLCDRKSDRLSPRKAHRPIASGALPPSVAVAGCLAALAVSAALSWHLGAACMGIIGLYLLMNLAYCFCLKHAVLADVMVIALGFVLRVLLGVYAIHARPTPWIVLCMFFLALLLGLAKRRAELATLKERAAVHRPVLARYTLSYLDVLLAVMAALSIICYAVYTVLPQHNPTLIVTIPPVVYGIARYLLLVMVHGGDAPEEMLTRDPGLVSAVLAWVGLSVLVLYGPLQLFG
jgi:4-hydroxybenzoate polyprenyltransferase